MKTQEFLKPLFNNLMPLRLDIGLPTDTITLVYFQCFTQDCRGMSVWKIKVNDVKELIVVRLPF